MKEKGDLKMSQIEMIPVSSSNVESIGYDASTQTLQVKFLNGGLYLYRNVPPMIYEQLSVAPSIGSYLNRNIKGSYPYEKIG
jgi:hypothetical protein